MRSPSRPALSARNGRDMLLKDPNYAARKEKERRRLLRLQQVRQRSAEAARTIRQRVQREQIRQIQKIGNQELEKFRQSKTNELMRLEAEYQKALQDIGLGHEAAAEEIKFQRWKADQQVLHAQVAEVRGEHALKVVLHQKMLQNKLQEEKSKFRKSVKLAEEARAAEVRTRKSKIGMNKEGFTTGKVVEIDLSQLEDVAEKRVRFEGHSDPNIRIIKRKDSTEKPGVEAAIQEEVQRSHMSQDQVKNAQMRGVAALRRAKMARQQVYITESFFEDSDVDSKIEFEELGAHVHQPSGEDELDLVPSKMSSLSDSSTSLHASLTHLPTEPVSERNFVGRIQGASGGIKSNNQIHESKESQKTRRDDEFIAKVLQGLQDDAVNVDVRVEEVSTFASSSAASVSRQSLPSSCSSTDITQERFLSQDWDIRGLIGQLRVEKQPDQQESQVFLRRRIERLLSMKREEIANLSVTDTSEMESSTSTTTATTSSTSSGLVSSTPASILSSNGSKSSLQKSVRFRNDTLDGSYREKSREDEEQKRKEIIEKTRISLQKVHAYYEEQRQRLEAELEARRKQKENLSPPLSEGLLSSSSSSVAVEKKVSSSSAKDSSWAEDEPESSSKKAVVRKSHTMSRQMTARLNKSSSSGTTTTSGSVATAELLSKLRRLEIPSLERPRPPRTLLLSPVDDLNTSADLMKASELESDETKPQAAVFSSFRFSADDVDFEQGLFPEKEVTSITLSSSSSS